MTATDPERASLLASAVRRRILAHLAALPRLAAEGETRRECGLTAAELGTVLGLHTTTVRFHLDQLVRAGLVTTRTVRSGGAGRPAKRYSVDEDQLAQPPEVEGPYQVLASLLAEAMDTDSAHDQQLTLEEAGVAWVRQRLGIEEDELGERPATARTQGQWLGKVGDLVDLLGEWGYQPDLTLDGAEGDITLTLHDCPFLALAQAHPSVVCGIHRGLLQGAIEATGEPHASVTLRPFVTQDTCHALIVRHTPDPDEHQEDAS